MGNLGCVALLLSSSQGSGGAVRGGRQRGRGCFPPHRGVEAQNLVDGNVYKFYEINWFWQLSPLPGSLSPRRRRPSRCQSVSWRSCPCRLLFNVHPENSVKRLKNGSVSGYFGFYGFLRNSSFPLFFVNFKLPIFLDIGLFTVCSSRWTSRAAAWTSGAAAWTSRASA